MRASECLIRITSVASEREQRFSLTLADHIHMNPFLDLGTGAREELLVVAKRASVIKGGREGRRSNGTGRNEHCGCVKTMRRGHGSNRPSLTAAERIQREAVAFTKLCSGRQ